MNRRSYLASVVTGIIGANAGCAWATETYRNPVFENVFADPTVIQREGSYFAYGTYQDWGNPGQRRLVPVVRSPNLVDWRYVGEAFRTKPDWREQGGLWAPDIGRLAGRFVLYYSYASFQAGNPGIGVATSNDPAGPFDDRGPLFRSDEIDVPHSIDPCLFLHRGTPFLIWGSHAGIYGIRLSDNGLRTIGEKFRVVGEGVEAAYVIRRGDFFYLFGSRGTCCEGAKSTYRVVVGRANSLRGPYRNRDGENLLSATGTTILHGDDRFAGPGHCAVTRGPDGNHWLLYHAYERSNPWVGKMPRRVLMLDRLDWRDGWPVVPGKTPSAEHRVPTAGSDLLHEVR